MDEGIARYCEPSLADRSVASLLLNIPAPSRAFSKDHVAVILASATNDDCCRASRFHKVCICMPTTWVSRFKSQINSRSRRSFDATAACSCTESLQKSISRIAIISVCSLPRDSWRRTAVLVTHTGKQVGGTKVVGRGLGCRKLRDVCLSAEDISETAEG